jgi:hypothetical protein
MVKPTAHNGRDVGSTPARPIFGKKRGGVNGSMPGSCPGGVSSTLALPILEKALFFLPQCSFFLTQMKKKNAFNHFKKSC